MRGNPGRNLSTRSGRSQADSLKYGIIWSKMSQPWALYRECMKKLMEMFNSEKHLAIRRTCGVPWRLVNLHFKPCVEVIQWIWEGGAGLYFKVGHGLNTLPHVVCVSGVQGWGCPEGVLVTWCEAASQVFFEAVNYVLLYCICLDIMNRVGHNKSTNVSDNNVHARYCQRSVTSIQKGQWWQFKVVCDMIQHSNKRNGQMCRGMQTWIEGGEGVQISRSE